MRCEVERRAEALDLQRPRELSADAVRDAAGRNGEEREEDERDDRREQAEADECLAPAPPTPDVGRSHGDENGRVELHRDRRTEHAEAETVALVDERGECARNEHRRPEIEAGEDDRAEEEREAGDEREHPHGAGPRGPQSVAGRRR